MPSFKGIFKRFFLKSIFASICHEMCVSNLQDTRLLMHWLTCRLSIYNRCVWSVIRIVCSYWNRTRQHLIIYDFCIRSILKSSVVLNKNTLTIISTAFGFIAKTLTTMTFLIATDSKVRIWTDTGTMCAPSPGRAFYNI